jgi:hypothetical protein
MSSYLTSMSPPTSAAKAASGASTKGAGMGKERPSKRDAAHVRIHHKMTDTPAWQALSGSAVKVLLAIAKFDNGRSNGAIFFSDRVGATVSGFSRNTVRRALGELIDKGFIRCTEKGGFSRKVRHAASYRLTWVAWPEGRMGPTREYETWTPFQNPRAQILTETGPVSDTSDETDPLTGADIEPDETEKPLVSAKQPMSGIEPQLVYQAVAGSERPNDQRKQANLPRAAILAELRESLIARLADAEPGEQSRLALKLGIPGGTLSRFINGRNLPAVYQQSLTILLRPAQQEAA